MTKKSSPPRFAPLQRITAEIVTDPAELAAFDAMLRERRQANRLIETLNGFPDSPSPSALEASNLFRQLPEQERLALLARLIAQLSTGGQIAVFELLTSQLPSEVFHQVEEELRQRLVQSSPPPCS